MNPVRNNQVKNPVSKQDTDKPKASRVSYGMKVLIGTPIHEVKDYAMQKWLKNVAGLQKRTPADLLLVDNSPDLNYVKRVRQYCKKYGVKKYIIKHFSYNQGMSISEIEIRVQKAKEIIRREVLAGGYDAWFSWECDQIIPNNALEKLIKIMKSGNFMMVAHNSWWRTVPTSLNFSMGCTLIKRECLKLKKFKLLFEHVDSKNPEQAADWLEDLFRKRILQISGTYATVQGIIDPIYHLNNENKPK